MAGSEVQKKRAVIEMLDLAAAGLPEIPLLGRYTFRQAQGRLEEHRHTGCLELCCLVEGRQTYRLHGGGGLSERECRLRAGDLFITLPDEEHDTAGQPQERGALFWLHLRLNGKRLLGLGRAESALLRERLLAIPSRHFPGGKKVVACFAALHASARQRDGLAGLRIGACCLQLLLAVLDVAGQGVCAGVLPEPLKLAMEYIRKNLGQPLQVWEVARAARVSGSWLQDAFRSHVGMPPGEYILREKIAAAREALRRGRSVTETAHALGFSSSQYFATVFKRFTTCTPSRWLQENAE